LAYNEELTEKAAWLAKRYDLMVSIDMASYNVVEDKLDFFKHLVDKYIDVVFANEEEARAFTGYEPVDALHKISENTLIAVVKTGEKGSMIKYDGKIYNIEAIKVKPVDTTGAGDFYAAGFLYGLTKNFPMEKCGSLGSYLAGRVTEFIGAKPSADVWTEIENNF